MTTVIEVVGVVLLFGGLLLATIGLYGMLRHARASSTSSTPPGSISGPAIILVLAASIATRAAEIITSAALVILFVLVTAPLSGHAIAQAARRRPPRAAPARPSGSRR